MSDVIQEIRYGNKAAVKAVYQKYAKDVYNFAKSITGDHDSALFATKKTFSILFNNIKNGENPTNLRTAALKIAYDEAYNAATSIKADNASETYADSESPANKTYLRPRNVENNQRTYQAQPSNSDYYDDDKYDDYASRSSAKPSAKKQYQKTEYVEDDNYRRGYNHDTYDEDNEFEDNDGYDENYDNKYDEFEQVRDDSRNYKRSKTVYNAFEDEDEDNYDNYDDEDDDYDDERPHKRQNKGLFVFCIIINIILILILLWFLCGLLVNLGVLPSIDLGYTWFNGHIYPLF